MTTGVQPDNETRFNEWHANNDGRIRALCLDYLPDLPIDEDAEDLTQEICMRIWENIEQFDPEIASFDTWANKVAINVLNNYLDYENADKRTGDMEEYDDEQCAEYYFHRPTAIAEPLNLLFKYIDHLEGRDRNVMQMYRDGYTHIEISNFLNITKGQVNHAIRRSKKLIKEMAIEDEDYDFGEVAVAL